MIREIDKIIDKPLETIVKDGVNSSNLDYLYKLIDIKKEITYFIYGVFNQKCVGNL